MPPQGSPAVWRWVALGGGILALAALLVGVVVLLFRGEPAPTTGGGSAGGGGANPGGGSGQPPRKQITAPPVWKGHASAVYTVAFSKTKFQVISGGGGDKDNSVRLWDAWTGKLVKKCLDKFTDHISSVAFSPDGRLAVIACAGYWNQNGEYVLGTDFSLRLWDLETDQELTQKIIDPNQPKKGIPRLTGHTGEVFSVAFSPDGSQILSAARDYTTRLWDVKSGRQVHCLQGHTNTVYKASFSPDGSQAISASADYTVRLWDLKTGREIRRMGQASGGHTDIVWTADFSPDGRYAVSGSGKQLDLVNRSNGVPRFWPGTKDFTVRLWDVQTGTEVRRFTGHTDAVLSVAFTPDGRHLLSGGIDHMVRLWEVATGKQLRVFTEHTDMVSGVAVYPDGKHALSAGRDGTLRFWKLFDGP
jgi:WD40 repeat protein